MTVCSTALRFSTPSTVMKPVPPPRIFAPIRVSIAITSSTSGSSAAFSITVVPLASVAAMTRFSVPVCEGVSR